MLVTELAQYLAIRVVAGLIQCFDVDQNLATAATIGSLYHRFSPHRRDRAETNIARSFPDWSREQVVDLAERSLQYMFQLFLVDALITPRLVTPSSWPRHIRLGRLGPVLDPLIRDRPLILLTGHCGNWELVGHTLAVLGYPITALARPLDNRFLNRWVVGLREARGTRVITKWGATPVVEQVIRDSGRIGFIADQNAGDQGLFVPFFGRLASSYKSIGLLAMRHEVPIAAGLAYRLDNTMSYQLECTEFISPDDWVDQPDPLFYVTARFNRAIENMILMAPEQYLWVHRRWKSRPRHEREGKPFPNKLRKRLEDLPWMTQEELTRIMEASERDAREIRDQAKVGRQRR